MKFNIKISKLSIFCFYLINLALVGKKYWIRKEYNVFLLLTGPLTKSEKNALRRFSKIVSRLESRKNSLNLLGIFFYRNPWIKLREQVNDKTYLAIKNIFQIMRPRFNVFWKKNIKDDKGVVEKQIKNNIKINLRWFEKLFIQAANFYGTERIPLKLTVFLILLPAEIKGVSGKYISSLSGVLIEVSKTSVARKRVVEIILHEAIHLYLENNRFNNMLQESIKKHPSLNKKVIKLFEGRNLGFIVKEVINSVISLRSMMFHSTSLYHNLLVYAIEKTENKEIKKFLEGGRMVNDEFMEKIIDIVQEYVKKAARPISRANKQSEKP